MEVKIVSYNIRKAVGLDRRRHPERILSILGGLDADVVVLQEADRRLGSRPTALPRFLIEQETDYRAVDLARTDVSLGWHGNAVLVRRGLKIDETAHFDLPGLEPRGAVMVGLGGLHVVGAHLGLLRRWRLRQMRAILDHLGTKARHAIVCGDFNEWSRDGGFEPWNDVLRVVSPGATFHAARPVAPLDRFAHGPGVQLRETGVLRQGAARIASDHLPVWCVADAAAGLSDGAKESVRTPLGSARGR